MRVLIADGNEAIREILSEILTAGGCEVQAVGSVDSAVRETSSFRPDVIILDNVMAARVADSISAEQNIIVMVSADDIPYEGVAGVIQKPLKSADVFRTICEVFPGVMKEGSESSIFDTLFRKEEPA